MQKLDFLDLVDLEKFSLWEKLTNAPVFWVGEQEYHVWKVQKFEFDREKAISSPPEGSFGDLSRFLKKTCKNSIFST